MGIRKNKSREISVEFYSHMGKSMRLKDIEEWCAEARAAGFGDEAVPWSGDNLVYLHVSRSERE